MNDTPAPAATPREETVPRPLALIAAVASNGVIGRKNRLPWRLPDDLQRFRALTTGHTIVMGRKTWDSIATPLPGRQNIVVSRDRAFAARGVSVAHSLEQAIAMAVLPGPIFVIGGEALYRAALPIAELMYITEIDRDFAGDTRFPDYERGAWRETAREPHLHPLDGNGGFAYAFVAYERARV